MLIKVITIPFSSALGGFNDEELRGFLRDKELISAKEYFFVKDDVPYLTIVLRYFPYRAEAHTPPAAVTTKPAGEESDWREMLNEEQMGLFNLLRDWRSQRCKKDGVPPYIVFNNRQLALITKLRPQTLAELSSVEGIGKKKLDSYGPEVPDITKWPQDTATPSASSQGEGQDS